MRLYSSLFGNSSIIFRYMLICVSCTKMFLRYIDSLKNVFKFFSTIIQSRGFMSYYMVLKVNSTWISISFMSLNRSNFVRFWLQMFKDRIDVVRLMLTFKIMPWNITWRNLLPQVPIVELWFQFLISKLLR